MITVTIWHNVAFDAEGRHTAMLDGYQPGDPVVAAFTYQADPAGRTAEQIAAEAFDIFNDHRRDPGGADLACAYYGRRLRSLSFPGNSPCCGRSCCVHSRAVWSRSSSRPSAERTSCERQPDTGGSHHDGTRSRSSRYHRSTRPRGSPGVRWWLPPGAPWTYPPIPGGT
jgi:hypothetical protein